jgi:small-conductance mechanosensitive channel/CRP-like cAMP-binding protein
MDRAVRFATLPGALAIIAGVVLIAFLVNRFAPRKRRHIRRASITGLFYAVSFAVSIVLAELQLKGAASAVRQISEVLGILTVVNLAALLLFDVALPAIRMELASITADLAVGLGYIVAVLFSLRALGFDFSSIVTTSALMTTIIAFSLQSTLSNVVGGVALQLDGSIHVGDWVQLENGRQGKVREIRWRYTVIETRDWDTLIVPNASLLGATISILGKRDGEPTVKHRMWVYFNVDFRFSPGEVVRAVQDALTLAPIEGVARDPAPNCICYDFAKDGRDSFSYYAVRYWLTDLARDDPTSSLIRERVHAALRRAQIPLAMPGSRVWVETDDVARDERRAQREQERRMKALSAVEFLKPLREEELAQVAEGLRVAPFARGETITKQGFVAHWLYILTAGTVEVHVDVDGTDRLLATLEGPSFFGEMGLMTGAPRTATLIAVTDAECYRLDKATFRKILAERPEMAAEMSALLASRTVELHSLKEDLDAEAKRRRIEYEKRRILRKVQTFFGLSDEPEAT